MGVNERRLRDRSRRRESILDAAERVFVREGYETSTMDQVASEAEVSKGTVYLYFENKDALRAAIGERWIATLIESLRPRLDAAGSGLDGVRAVLESYHEHFASRPNHCRLMLGWINGPPDTSHVCESFEAHRARVRQLVGMVIQTIERGRRDGSIREDVDAPLLSLQLWGGFLGVWMIVMNREQVQNKIGQTVSLDGLVTSFHDTMLQGIAGPAAARRGEVNE